MGCEPSADKEVKDQRNVTSDLASLREKKCLLEEKWEKSLKMLAQKHFADDNSKDVMIAIEAFQDVHGCDDSQRKLIQSYHDLEHHLETIGRECKASDDAHTKFLKAEQKALKAANKLAEEEEAAKHRPEQAEGTTNKKLVKLEKEKADADDEAAHAQEAHKLALNHFELVKKPELKNGLEKLVQVQFEFHEYQTKAFSEVLAKIRQIDVDKHNVVDSELQLIAVTVPTMGSGDPPDTILIQPIPEPEPFSPEPTPEPEPLAPETEPEPFSPGAEPTPEPQPLKKEEEEPTPPVESQ